MHKKDNSTDGVLIKEDPQIKRVAASSTTKITVILVVILILLFLFTLFISICYIDIYHSITVNGDEEIITVHTDATTATIVNNGVIAQTITTESFNEDDEIVVENINVLEISPLNDTSNAVLKYNVSYDIDENAFNKNTVATNNSEVLVKFSYSFDGENWNYINNALSTYNSNILPLVGNTYDIAGLIGPINVATDYELLSSDGSDVKIYWKSETIFKNVSSITEEKEFKANFAITYSRSK